jgi:hypothetical protein
MQMRRRARCKLLKKACVSLRERFHGSAGWQQGLHTNTHGGISINLQTRVYYTYMQRVRLSNSRRAIIGKSKKAHGREFEFFAPLLQLAISRDIEIRMCCPKVNMHYIGDTVLIYCTAAGAHLRRE